MTHQSGTMTKNPKARRRPAAAVASGGEFVTLLEVAAQLRIEGRKLRQMAARGEFPQLLAVNRKHALVRREDFENWKAGRWTREQDVRAALVVDAAVRTGVENRRKRKAAK